MNTRIYEYIITAAEQKNITKAAGLCFISQPALSQHIKNLESQLGFPIFEKQGAQLLPTKQGEIFLTTARRMLHIEQETMEKLEEYKKTAPKTYRVFVDTHMRNLLIESIWPQFLKQFPDIRLSLISGDTATAIEYLSSQTVDIGIFPIHDPLPPDLASIPVDQNEYLLVLPPNHPCIKPFTEQGIDFRQLKDETFILNQNYSLFSTMQYQIFDRYGLAPRKKLYSHSMQTITRMVSNGQGISFLPDIIVSLVNQQCTAFSLSPPWYFHHAAAYHKSRGLDACNSLLIDLLIRHYQQLHLG